MLLDALMLQRLAVRLCLDADDTDSADAWLRANDRWLSWSGSVLGRAENHLIWAERHRAAGDTGTAWRCANQAVAAASTPLQPLALLQSRRLKGELARERGDAGITEETLTSSLILATRCEIPFERARSLLALARLQATSDRPAARASATEALEISRALGAAFLAEQVKRLLGDLTPETDRVEAPAGLTPRELDVLRLVAQGMTDAEVGDALSISSRTVSQHLRSVYSKLSVRSRLEATRYAMGHGLI